jgi:hypothetical protein
MSSWVAHFLENQAAIGHLTAKDRDGLIDAIFDSPRVGFDVRDSQHVDLLFLPLLKK